MLPIALFDVLKVTKVGKYKHPHGTNLETGIGGKIIFFYTPAVPSRQQQLVQTAHFAACVSVQRARHRLLAAAVAVMKLVCNKHEVMKQ